MTVRTVGTLAVDRTRCAGHGLCRVLLPDRVAADEWGFPILSTDTVTNTVTAADASGVRRAVAACPALALYLDRTR